MGTPLKSVTIVGGGTSGWLAAAFLARAMQSDVASGKMTITLIESPKIPIIGVGEATSPALPKLFQYIGVDESRFIKDANVAFKMSGYFEGWNEDEDGAPLTWLNPFLATPSIGGISPASYYAAFGDAHEAGITNFSSLISSGPALVAARKAPRAAGAPDYSQVFPYAYHFDAMEVAKILRDTALARGVRHILDDVTGVNLDERGFVASLDLAEHGQHPIDLVIDSTGFAGVIINKTLKEPFDPFSRYLINDRAAVVQLPHGDAGDIEPVSRAKALKAGWRFIVPLYNRVGTGYVFSSKFTSDEEAIATLKEDIGPHIGDREPRIIPMRIGKSRRSWVKNCVAIGLSSGFAEPLEATAIHSVDLAVRWLYSHFPDSDFNPALQNSFNRLVDEFYLEVIDFIALHFHLSNRNELYWRAFREEIKPPDSLTDKLELWRYKMPSDLDLSSSHFFNANNYIAALMGKGFYAHKAPHSPGISRTIWDQFCAARRAQTQKLMAATTTHKALLDSYHTAPTTVMGHSGLGQFEIAGLNIGFKP